MSERMPDDHDGSRDFDDPNRYEREKATRIMPADLQRSGMYTLRMMFPPGRKPFGAEFLTCITEEATLREDGNWDISYVWYPSQASREVEEAGFMIVLNRGPRKFEGLPDEIEIGYFVGSIDPFDLELAELVGKSQELVDVR